MLLRLIISLLLAYHPHSYAIADTEIAESNKCSKLFPYYEKKLNIPTNTLHSIALKESGKKHKKHKISVVWPWAVNVEGKGYYFNSKKEAVIFVKKQIIKGKENIDVGCMQINLKHHLEAFDSLNQAFDPSKNIKYGAEFLRSKYDRLGSWHKAIAHYHSATHSLGNKYKQDVAKIASNMALYKASLSNYGDNTLENAAAVESFSNLTNNSRVQKKSLFNSNKRYRSSIMVPIPVKTNSNS
ncbi:lytic transglycosylase domain-containing protein [Rickettsia endosymbiont of Halotydeus destructor]|uniref:lytic transglycosylase domain-containing protein n=1 Tax=Rickettsia endosymbiont of Halotydeus destructor TaxID=2996754 RepID=UPI003BAED49A